MHHFDVQLYESLIISTPLLYIQWTNIELYVAVKRIILYTYLCL